MKDQVLKIKIAILLISCLSLINFFGLLNAIESGVAWKIAAASIGFLGFFGMTLMLILQFLQSSK